ncbi:conserved hypothetical protein [Natranaerobius thermophilus JW/NM-WN-LF]|uniref:GumN family protein n=1 Tax=Natranaerobius thermophilus (strain ATCC BAA-1301 / DSM 18059 / JW/NM-WN-LF) TaxID=457570 RepID=B2A113_NATTJ|nr:conserved hypothetical protein [Natranaerobius thermophilus JW/NM-WN-LF]
MLLGKTFWGSLTLMFTISFLLIAVGCNETEVTEIEESEYFFYEIAGGENDMYILGTVHIGHPDMYPLDDSIYEAFDESDVLAMEIDPMNTPMDSIQDEYGTYQDETKVTDVISEELFYESFELIKQHNTSISEEELKNYKPWRINSLLERAATQESKYSYDHGVEPYFIGKAFEEDMELVELEDYEEDLVKNYELLSEESQEKMLENTLDGFEDYEEGSTELITDWEEGNVSAEAKKREERINEAETDSMAE